MRLRATRGGAGPLQSARLPLREAQAPPAAASRVPSGGCAHRPLPHALFARPTEPSQPLCRRRAARSVAFPLDLVALAALVLFLFWASLFAIGSIGVRVACLLLYRVRPAATSPQGPPSCGSKPRPVADAAPRPPLPHARSGPTFGTALLLVAVLMQLVGFMLCLQLPALLPQYATFGAQTVAAPDGTRRPCSLQSAAATDGRCHSTYMVRMTHRVYSGIPALAVLFQFVNWAFVAACAWWAARAACLRNRSGRRRSRQDQMDEEEVQGLLDG